MLCAAGAYFPQSECFELVLSLASYFSFRISINFISADLSLQSPSILSCTCTHITSLGIFTFCFSLAENPLPIGQQYEHITATVPTRTAPLTVPQAMAAQGVTALSLQTYHYENFVSLSRALYCIVEVRMLNVPACTLQRVIFSQCWIPIS